MVGLMMMRWHQATDLSSDYATYYGNFDADTMLRATRYALFADGTACHVDNDGH